MDFLLQVIHGGPPVGATASGHDVAPMGPFDPYPQASQGVTPDGAVGGLPEEQGHRAHRPQPRSTPPSATATSSTVSARGDSGSMEESSFSTHGLSSNLPAAERTAQVQPESNPEGSTVEPMIMAGTAPDSDLAIMFESYGARPRQPYGGAKPKSPGYGPTKSRMSERDRSPPVVTLDDDNDPGWTGDDEELSYSPPKSCRPRVRKDKRQYGPGTSQETASRSLKSSSASVSSAYRPRKPYQPPKPQSSHHGGKSPNQGTPAGAADSSRGDISDDNLELMALRKEISKKTQAEKERFYNEAGVDSITYNKMPFFTAANKKKDRVKRIVREKIKEINLSSKEASMSEFRAKCLFDPADVSTGEWRRRFEERYDVFVDGLLSEYLDEEFFDMSGKLIEDRAEKFISRLKGRNN